MYSPLKGVIVEVYHSEAIQKGCILCGKETSRRSESQNIELKKNSLSFFTGRNTTLSQQNETSPVKQSTSLLADLSSFIYCDIELNKPSCDGCLDIEDMEMHPSDLNALCDYVCRATKHEGGGC